MKNLLLAVSIVVFVSGCAAPARYGYVKEGVTQAVAQSAMAKCQYQIKLQKTAAEREPELLKLCMEGEGFRLKRVN